MPVHPLFPTKAVHTPKFAYFLNPSDLPKETRTWIAKTIGSSANGLNITEADIEKDLQTKNLSGITMVWNSPTNWAFGNLQYHDWLEKGTPQLWITDVCRIGTKDPKKPSPIQGLLKLLNIIALQYGIETVWVMVEEDASADILQSVYEGYGFLKQGFNAPLNVHLMNKSIKN